jgi:ketosteroid isomerase-like protein
LIAKFAGEFLFRPPVVHACRAFGCGIVNDSLREEKIMLKRLLAFVLLSSALAFSQTSTQQELTTLLHNFLDGAAKGDKAAFERFFDEDVIYTRAVGAVIDRASILKNVEPPKPGEPADHYDAEDILVHQKGDVAVMNFRLVVEAEEHGKPEKSYYRNTGTFLRENGQWKVIAWQATPIVENK